MTEDGYRVKCPRCGLPTIVDRPGVLLDYEEMLCDSCYSGTCRGCHKVDINNAEDELCLECQISAAEAQEYR